MSKRAVRPMSRTTSIFSGGFRPAVESDVSLQSRSLVLIFSLSTSMEQQFLDFRANLPGMVAGMGGVLDDISSYVFVGYVSTSESHNHVASSATVFALAQLVQVRTSTLTT